jgi:hypothetical protein
MARVAAVYTVAPSVRTLSDVLADLRPVRDASKDRDAPRPLQNKRVWASVEKEPEAVIRDAFEDARRRDPDHRRWWVVLVDGNRDQLRLVKKTARKVGVDITILVDLIHVLEYLWKAAYAFHVDGSKDAEAWVQQRLMWLLQGERAKVRANLRRNATARGLADAKDEARPCVPSLRPRRAELPCLQRSPRRRSPHRDRRDRGRLPLPCEGPDGEDWGSLVARGRRSSPPPPRSSRKR